MGTTTPFRKNLAAVLNGAIDYAADSIQCALVNGYSPSFDTDQYWDVTGHSYEITGVTGYTAGGVVLASKTNAYTPANSWGDVWTASTADAAGQVVRPSTGNGHLYRCVVAGTTGSSAPTWPTTSGQTVTDGTVTWEECGAGIVVLSAASPQWNNGGNGISIPAVSGAVVFDNTPSSDKPMLAYVDFGGTQTTSNGVVTVTFDAYLGFFCLTTP